MILAGTRQKEILTRAANREVTGIITMVMPQDRQNQISPGLIVEERKPAFPLTVSGHFAQVAQYWQMDDTCRPAAERNPRLLHEVVEAVSQRTHAFNQGEYGHLFNEEQKVVFNCEDLVCKATGIPPKLTLEFHGAQDVFGIIETVPFPKIQGFLKALQAELLGVGGQLHAATIAHASNMSAYDYYELATERYVQGHRFSDADRMLRKAYNLLGKKGMPLVTPARPATRILN